MTRTVQIFIKDVNPEPWTVPDLGLGRKPGGVYPIATTKAVQRMYQTAIRESVQQALPSDFEMFPDEQRLELRIVVRRQIETITKVNVKTGKSRTTKGHIADATNIQKATEDALQGLIFTNDNQVGHASCEIIAQGEDEDPGIYITVKPYVTAAGWPSSFNLMASVVPPGHTAWITNEEEDY